MRMITVYLLATALLIGSAEAQLFNQISGTANGTKAAIAAWKADETARQGGTLASWWLWGNTSLDYDGNGFTDLALCHHSLPGAAVLKNNGDGTFSDTTVPMFTTDKRLLPHCSTGEETQFQWNGTQLTTVLPVVPPAPALPPAIEAFIAAEFAKPENEFLKVTFYEPDTNNDGRNDVVVRGFAAYANGSKFTLLLIRQADGSLVDQTPTSGLPPYCYPVLIEDLTGEGRKDFLVASGKSWPGWCGQAAAGLYVANADFTYSKLPNPNLEAIVKLSAESYPMIAWAKDFDQDGLNDLVVNSPRLGQVGIYQNVAGVLVRIFHLTGTWDADPVAFGDFDVNGGEDVAVGIGKVGNNHEVTLYMNTHSGTPPAPEPLFITTAPELPVPAYSQNLVAEGGVEPYEWTLESGTLPSGFSLTPEGVVVISQTCPYNFVAKVTDAEDMEDAKGFQINAPCEQTAGSQFMGGEREALLRNIEFQQKRIQELWSELGRRETILRESGVWP